MRRGKRASSGGRERERERERERGRWVGEKDGCNGDTILYNGHFSGDKIFCEQ